MKILGHVTDREQLICHEHFRENDFELRANGVPGYASFESYLQKQVDWYLLVNRLDVRVHA
jgi:hypothetical protein